MTSEPFQPGSQGELFDFAEEEVQTAKSTDVYETAEGGANIQKIKPPREVRAPDMKTLWSKANGRCAHPDCRGKTTLLLEPSSAGDGNAVIGEMAHIVAYSDAGPRGDASFPESERNLYPNLILLCRNHHGRVDKQPNITPSSQLRAWKSDWERTVNAAVKKTVQTVPFAELKLVADYLVRLGKVSEAAVSEDFSLPTEVRSKLRKNQLSAEVERVVAVAQSRHGDMTYFVEQQEKLLPAYPECLRRGLATEFERLAEEGFEGDDLYYAIRDFAAGNARSDVSLGAASVVISYFFVMCEVFEP